MLPYIVDGEDIGGDHSGVPGIDSIEMKGSTTLPIHAYHDDREACRELVGVCPVPLGEVLPILRSAQPGLYELSTSKTPPPGGGGSQEGTNGKLNVGSGREETLHPRPRGHR
ncbi:MAG TPA: hypothetical protein VN253_21655 [Kofleriaceae bacterium]|nr:hypothetical protein [Kofleriaceae bacterium]